MSLARYSLVRMRRGCLQALHETLAAKHYAPRTIRNYMQQMRFLFAHYHDVAPHAITQQQIIAYINFIIREHGVGRAKCHLVAMSCSFYYKHVFPTPFIVPSGFYPHKQHKLPQVFTQAQIAITRHRIVAIMEHSLTFSFKDYADKSRTKQMTIGHAEFLRRFELHFLPRGYVKIRYYGYLKNQSRVTRLNAVRKNMQIQPLPPKVLVAVGVRMLEQYGTDISLCPKCKTGRLVPVSIVYPVKTAAIKPVGLRNKASPAGQT